MEKLKLIELILGLNSETKHDCFLKVGTIYAFRTVTMIYTGRLKAINDKEFLIESAAWIPETERWAQFVDNGAHKEAEPYKRDVVLNRGALLDVTEISQLVTVQK
jgi:hypothetical protein